VNRTMQTCTVGLLAVLLWGTGGCQVSHRTDEIRSDEPMLEVSFENEEAEKLFVKAVHTTFGREKNVARIGLPGLSLYSRDETVAWNASCNDHIRKIDTDGNLFITEQEARSYYQSITATAAP